MHATHNAQWTCSSDALLGTVYAYSEFPVLHYVENNVLTLDGKG